MGFLNGITLVNVITRSFAKLVDVNVMKYLNVAEKNDAAKNIAAILSRGNSSRREGLSNYNKIYEFNGTVLGQQARMVMTSVSGHLLNYEFVSLFRKWESCNPVALFDAPVFKNCPEDYQKIKKTLEREVRTCQGLIIWTDCDREGENIGFEVIKVCSDVKPNLKIFRAKFSEITGPSVFRALNSLGQPNKNVSDAVDVRQELDLRTGAAFTRLQTLRLQKVFPGKLTNKLISYGSCQFPTLGFVVERYQAIEDFIPEPFWKIKLKHCIKDLAVDFIWKRDRLFDKDACQAILDICKEDPTATVERVESKTKNKWRPLPLDTVVCKILKHSPSVVSIPEQLQEMEKTISRKLKINAKDTMKIAERLYTQGLISYPRTETNIFPKELNLGTLVEQQVNDNRWGSFAQRVVADGPNPRQGRKSDQAHPPIHPTKYANNLSGNEQKVYEYIVRHFLACVSKDALGFETTVHADVAQEKFTAKGLMILERNYLDVYIYEKWNAKEIHNYNESDTFTPTELDMVDGSTSAPKLLTEADLIALMEKNGIGTDATHADHIDTIKSREYVGLHENIYFVPGTLGMGLVEGYNSIGLEVSLAKPNLRADFENDLKLICDGLKDPDEVRREQIGKYREVFKKVVDKMVQIDRSLANRLEDQPRQLEEDPLNNQEEYKPVLKCPKCGNDMVVKSRKNAQGKYLSCVGYPGCKNSVWFDSNVESVEVLDAPCKSCGPDVKEIKMKFKQNPFRGEPNPSIHCIGGCDSFVLETLDINPNSVRKSNSTNTSSIVRPVQENRNFIQSNLTESSRISAGNDFRRSSQTRSNNERQNNSFDNNSRLSVLPGPSRSSTSNSFNGSRTVEDDEVVCSCNAPAVLLTVRKEGPNTGRKFYKCQQSAGGGGCDFFMWAPDENASMQANTTATICNCPQQAILKTVQKEGPNKGRQFYSCSKPIGQGCNFFKWTDDVDSSSSAGGNDPWGGGGGFASTQTWTGGRNSNNKWSAKTKTQRKNNKNNRTVPYQSQTRTKRKCGLCGQEGHNRKNCPNS